MATKNGPSLEISKSKRRLQPLGSLALAPRWGGGGGRCSRLKRSGMLIGKFELNPKRTPIWVWLELYLTPKRYHLKWDKLDYRLLYRKGARASRANWRDQRKSSLKAETRAFLQLFLGVRRKRFLK